MSLSVYKIPDFQNSLQVHITTNTLLDQVVKYISNIPNVQTLKMDLEVLLHTMKIIEVICKNDPSQTKVEKKKILIDAFNLIFPNCLSEYELSLLDKSIDFLSTNELIQIDKVLKTNFEYYLTPIRSIYKKLFRKN